MSSTQGIEWRGIKFGSNTEVTWPDIANLIHSVGNAVELLKEVESLYAERPVVVIDEFDTIGDAEERGKFAALLKQLGDQNASIKFIFTGIGKSLDDLLGAHQSAHRQLRTHELPKLPWEGRREVLESASREFGLTVHNDVVWRISAVCDGYPYYVHLILEYMLWAAFEDESDVDELGWSHYHQGLRAAVESINAELRKPYDQAVVHRDEEFEEVVWSTADHDDLFRSLTSMFESYRIINRKRALSPTVDRDQYGSMLRKLRSSGYGAILQIEKKRVGWYSYREKMLRGYVRMQAEANGYELTGEREAPKQLMHISSAKQGYGQRHGPSLPRGVRQNVAIRDPIEEKK